MSNEEKLIALKLLKIDTRLMKKYRKYGLRTVRQDEQADSNLDPLYTPPSCTTKNIIHLSIKNVNEALANVEKKYEQKKHTQIKQSIDTLKKCKANMLLVLKENEFYKILNKYEKENDLKPYAIKKYNFQHFAAWLMKNKYKLDKKDFMTFLISKSRLGKIAA